MLDDELKHAVNSRAGNNHSNFEMCDRIYFILRRKLHIQIGLIHFKDLVVF